MATQVSVHYRGTLDDGTQFDCSYDRNEPITFVEGAHQVIPGFEKTVAEMQPGDKKTARCESVPNYEQLPVGQTVYFRNPSGYPMPALVEKIEDGKVYLDFNHNLAGKALTFELELVSREEAPESCCGGSCGDCGGGCSGCH